MSASANYTKRMSSHRSDDTMDDETEDKDDTKRKSRNLSEKKRRDQFNLLVNELNSMVSTGVRKMDKSTVLKATISFLRNHNEISTRSRVHEIQEDWKPSFLSNEEFTHLILEAVDGFIIVFSVSGRVHYVSESVTTLLGHLPDELLNIPNIYDLLWDEERNVLYQTLIGTTVPDTNLTFQSHVRRGEHQSIRNEHPYYELVNFTGYMRTDVCTSSGDDSSENDSLVFVGTGRLHTPQLIREMTVVDSAKSEFTSRHSMEWKFLFLDHRAPPIIGYLPFEVLGTSGYDYYHVDDLDSVVTCHEALMQKGEGTSCYYRFLTKGQQWIWLQTRFYITYHQWNSKPEFIVCTHRVVNYVDVIKRTRGEPTTTTPVLVSKPGSGTSSAWDKSGRRGHHRSTRAPSDCTSMSADSQTSRHSSQKQHVRAEAFQRPRGSDTFVEAQQQQQEHVLQQSVITPQYITAVPVQSVMTGFEASVIPVQVQSIENVVVTNDGVTDHIQAELQRKHAELQAIIGQQQAELRRVSEQLLMARLGLLTSPTDQSPPTQTAPTVVQQQQQELQQHEVTPLDVNTLYVCHNTGVSSTSEQQQQQQQQQEQEQQLIFEGVTK